MSSSPTDNHFQINIKDSSQEWNQHPPELVQNADFVVSPPLKKQQDEQVKSRASDLTMDFLLEHEKKNQIRNVVVNGYEKIGDYVVSSIQLVFNDIFIIKEYIYNGREGRPLQTANLSSFIQLKTSCICMS